MNDNEKVLKYRIYRVIYALKEKTQVYARKQWNKFDTLSALIRPALIGLILH